MDICPEVFERPCATSALAYGQSWIRGATQSEYGELPSNAL
jgi:hypothetical protein